MLQMNKEFNVGRLFAMLGAVVVVAGVASPTEKVPIVVLGLTFVFSGMLLYGFMKERGEK